MSKNAVNSENKSDIKEALLKNDEEWQKRMLLLVIIMMIAILGMD